MEELKSIAARELNLSNDLYNLAFSEAPKLDACILSESDCIESYIRRMRRTATTPDMSGPAVMYMPLGGSAPPGCPSIAESAVTAISQMVFLWTIMSVFAAVNNVVANINNNQNNNNNNDNNINLNIVSTQNTQISSNVNNANTISIMLPPPIPVLAGGRKLEAEYRLKRFIAREERLRKKREALSNEVQQNQNLNYSSMQDRISLISIDILKFLTEPKEMWFSEARDCLGRRVCQLAQNRSGAKENSVMKAVLSKLTCFALLYTELEDHSQAFINFMDAISTNEINGLDCEDVFWKCSTDDDVIYRVNIF